MTVLLPEGIDQTMNVLYLEVLELLRPIGEYDEFGSEPDFGPIE